MTRVDADAARIRIRRLARDILQNRLAARRLRRAAADLAADVTGLDNHLAGGGPLPACWLPPEQRPLPWE